MTDLRWYEGKLQYLNPITNINYGYEMPLVYFKWLDVPTVQREKNLLNCECHNVRLHECPGNQEFIKSMHETTLHPTWKCGHLR